MAHGYLVYKIETIALIFMFIVKKTLLPIMEREFEAGSEIHSDE